MISEITFSGFIKMVCNVSPSLKLKWIRESDQVQKPGHRAGLLKWLFKKRVNSQLIRAPEKAGWIQISL